MFMRFNHRFLLLTTSIALTLPGMAGALPTGGSVSSGTASISTAGSKTTVNQTSSKAVINWTGFNTGSGETVQFNDPNSSSITLNRVSGGMTSFNGALNSNGSVWVVNPSGILIGSTGKVNTAGFLASTSTITDANFLAGNYTFTPSGVAQNPAAPSIGNSGSITVAGAGLAALVGPTVVNTGTINAQAGKITLASGDSFTVDLAGDGLINLAASKAITQQAISNFGTLNAQGGSVVITAAQASNVLDNLINLDGVIEANNLTAANQSGDLEYGAKFTGSTGGNFTLDAYRNVTVDAGTVIAPATGLVSGVNKLNVTLNSDDTNGGAGSIYVATSAAAGSMINSNGGNITLGGGTNPATGYAVGDTAAGTDAAGNAIYANGIYLAGSLNAGGGNIILNGKGLASNSAAAPGNSTGVALENVIYTGAYPEPYLYGPVTIATSGGGSIRINGIGGTVAEGSSTGIYGDNATIASQTGGITLKGTSGAGSNPTGYSQGTGINLVSSALSATSGSIRVAGITGANNSVANGLWLQDGSVSTTSGPISLTGTSQAGPCVTAADIFEENVISKSGGITLAGNASLSNLQNNESIGLELDYSTIASGATGASAAPVSISGTGAALGVDGYGGRITTVDGKVTISGTSADIAGGTGVGTSLYNTEIDSTGTGANAGTVTISGTGPQDGIILTNPTFHTVDGNFYINGTGGSGYSNVIINEPNFTSTGKGTFNITPAGILTE